MEVSQRAVTPMVTIVWKIRRSFHGASWLKLLNQFYYLEDDGTVWRIKKFTSEDDGFTWEDNDNN